MVMVDGLPPESALKSKIRDGMSPEDFERAAKTKRKGWGGWSREAELLAVLVERIDWLMYVTELASGAEGVKQPRPLERPGVFPDGGEVDPSRAYKAALSKASALWSLEHGGAAPPPDWDPGIDPDDFAHLDD
jgi:hypothetical protein